MRYRRLDANYDMVFGFGQSDFFVDSPEAVGQAVLTRLRLNLGEWFLDTSDGTNWRTGVLGNNTSSTRDAIIQARILGTTGVNSILYYSSNFNSNTRQFNVAVSIDTIYGIYPTATSSSSTSSISTPPSAPPVAFFTLGTASGILGANELG